MVLRSSDERRQLTGGDVGRFGGVEAESLEDRGDEGDVVLVGEVELVAESEVSSAG